MADRWIYFVQQGGRRGPIKIGVASNVFARITELQCGQPQKLRLLATMPGEAKLESSLHRKFREHRLRGEWFTAHQDILEAVRAALELEQAPIPLMKSELRAALRRQECAEYSETRSLFSDRLRMAGLSIRAIAATANVSFDTAKSWRIGRRMPTSPDARSKLETAMRRHGGGGA